MAGDILPEGTDTIINGAGVGDGATSDESAGAPYAGTTPEGEDSAGVAASAKAKVADSVSSLTSQAGDKIRDVASQGKDRATDALDSVARLVTDAADTVDDRLGGQYGDYARQAAEAVSGFASTLRQKDVDELFDEARDLVRKSPAVAIGIAAALGFALVRVLKAGTTPTSNAAPDEGGTAGTGNMPTPPVVEPAMPPVNIG